MKPFIITNKGDVTPGISCLPEEVSWASHGIPDRVSLKEIPGGFFQIVEEPADKLPDRKCRALISLPNVIDGRTFSHNIAPEQVLLTDATFGSLAYLRPDEIVKIKLGNPNGGFSRPPEPKTLVVSWDGTNLKICPIGDFVPDFSHAKLLV